MSKIDDTLAERGKSYGEFTTQGMYTQRLKELFRDEDGSWEQMDDDMKEALDMIASKIARLINGDPTHIDSWHDIQGYARLVEVRLLEWEEEAKRRANEPTASYTFSVMAIPADSEDPDDAPVFHGMPLTGDEVTQGSKEDGVEVTLPEFPGAVGYIVDDSLPEPGVFPVHPGLAELVEELKSSRDTVLTTDIWGVPQFGTSLEAEAAQESRPAPVEKKVVAGDRVVIANEKDQFYNKTGTVIENSLSPWVRMDAHTGHGFANVRGLDGWEDGHMLCRSSYELEKI